MRQGQIYVMLRHVCFNASVFSRPVKIHAADIKSVLPKSNLFLPNSIEIIEVRLWVPAAQRCQANAVLIIVCSGTNWAWRAMQYTATMHAE